VTEPVGALDLRSCIRSIPDFPKPGIMFRDITPLLRNVRAFDEAVRRMAEPYREGEVDVVVGAESRGFIFGAPIALRLGAGFVPIRKKGKLPAETVSVTYDLEYGTDTMEMIVGVEFLIELAFLGGRAKLARYPVRSQIVYDDESP